MGAELIRFARSLGLIRGEWVAVDGSKFRAVSSVGSVREREAVKRYLESLELADQDEELVVEPSKVAEAILRIKRRLPNIFFVRELEFSQRRRLPGITQTILSGGIRDFRSGRRVSRRLACQFVVVATGFRSDYR